MELRSLRAVPDPLGSYLRPNFRDHKVLLQMLVDGRSVGTGLIADPCQAERHRDLLDEARRRGVETVLDPRALDLSTPGGYTRSGVAALPWSAGEPHEPSTLAGVGGTLLVRQLVSFIEAGGHSATLAPTHYLRGPDDPWLQVDAELTRQLRRELDGRGLGHVLIYYPLITKTTVLRGSEDPQALTAHLGGLPIDALWLRLHPFGAAGSGPLALRWYLQTCRALHALDLPLVAEHSGTVGVALLAFGAVGGIESGLTMGEDVDLDGYLRAPAPGKGGFMPAPRIYLHEIGAFLDHAKSGDFFAARGMKSAHGCQAPECCPRGWRDMLLEPRRHFATQRAHEVGNLSRVPATLRAGHYMENHLRPASDRAVRAAEIEPSLTTVRRRLESWRGTLGAELAERSTFTVSPPAAGKRLRRSA